MQRRKGLKERAGGGVGGRVEATHRRRGPTGISRNPSREGPAELGLGCPVPAGVAEGDSSEMYRRALAELHAIHRAEQALLLAGAAELVLERMNARAEPKSFPWIGPCVVSLSESNWRADLAVEDRIARADGVPLGRTLARLAAGLVNGETTGRLAAASAETNAETALAWARAAVALEPWPDVRLTLARTLLVNGEMQGAESELRDLARAEGIDWERPAARRLRAGILTTRALIGIWRGDPVPAMERLRQALRTAPEPHAAVLAILVAFATGDRGGLAQAAAVLKAETQPANHASSAISLSENWPHIARRLREHWARAAAATKNSDLEKSLVFEALCHADPWTAKVAFALLTAPRS